MWMVTNGGKDSIPPLPPPRERGSSVLAVCHPLHPPRTGILGVSTLYMLPLSTLSPSGPSIECRGAGVPVA